ALATGAVGAPCVFRRAAARPHGFLLRRGRRRRVTAQMVAEAQGRKPVRRSPLSDGEVSSLAGAGAARGGEGDPELSASPESAEASGSPSLATCGRSPGTTPH